MANIHAHQLLLKGAWELSQQQLNQLLQLRLLA
jgi:hypothetical protein